MISIALVAARLLLFLVFVVAGIAKLADGEGSRRALKSFGVPNALVALFALLLPLMELAVALALIPIASAWFGAVGALFLLLLFVFAIAANLALGRSTDCHCFGQLHSSPAGWATLVRNAVLASVAVFVVWQGWDDPGASAGSWLGDLSTAELAALFGGLAGLVLLAAEGILLLQMLRQQGRLLLRLDDLEVRLVGGASDSAAGLPAAPVVGLPVGARAPGFRLDGLRGETMTLEALVAAGRPVLLLFTNPSCGPCQVLMPEIGNWQREHSAWLTTALVSEGTADDNRGKSEAHGVTQVLLQKKREVAGMYQAWGTPAAVLIRPDGTIGSPVAQGADAIRGLVAQSIGTAPRALPTAGAVAQGNGQDGGRGHPMLRPSVVKMGALAPPLKFHDLDGEAMALTDFHGHKILVLFWNPGCGFCQQMLSNLKEWEANPPSEAPDLLVVSSGTVEENRAMNLRSRVVLDPNFQAGSAFGANGTPMAVLLDAKGRIASEIAVGEHAVLALAYASSTEINQSGQGLPMLLA
jgi:thiol-disulfide isomerase/thioredoxin